MTAMAGYGCLVRKSGVSTAITTEPCSIFAASSVRFQITDSTKRVIDPNTVWHVKDGTTTVAYSTISAVDFVMGQITFAAPLASNTALSVSFSGSYLPITTSSDVLLETKTFKLAQSRDLLDTTVFAGTTGGNANIRKRIGALEDVSLSVHSVAQPQDLATLSTIQFNGNPVVVEVFFGDVTANRFRGFCQIADIDRAAEMSGLVETDVAFKIASIVDVSGGLIASYAHKVQP